MDTNFAAAAHAQPEKSSRFTLTHNKHALEFNRDVILREGLMN